MMLIIILQIKMMSIIDKPVYKSDQYPKRGKKVIRKRKSLVRKVEGFKRVDYNAKNSLF